MTENACETWVFAFDGDYLNTGLAKPSDLEGYDIIIANSEHIHLEKLLRLSESRPKSCKWVTLIEGDAFDFVKPRPFVKTLLDSSDLVNCINKYTEDYFQSLTTAPVRFIGFPYPAEQMRSFAVPFEERKREIFLSPMLLNRWLEYFCARQLNVPMYGYEKRLTRTMLTIWKNMTFHRSFDRLHYMKKARRLYNDPQLEVRREVPLKEYLQDNRSAAVWLNLDHRYTWGRYVLDAAALQIPIVATRSTGQMEDFFPKTMLENEYEVVRARELLTCLLSDSDFYREVATVPLERFDHLRPEVKKKELLEALYSK
jgi:hypothetical protein